jgi:hypothetical protein
MSASNINDDVSTPGASEGRLRSARYLALGSLVVGILWGASVAFERIAVRPERATSHAGAILQGLAIAVAFAVATGVLALVGRVAVTIIRNREERAARSDDATIALATRAVAAFERMVEVLERRPAASAGETTPVQDREHRLDEIGHAARASRWADVAALLDDFQARFPDDPVIAGFRDRLDQARQEQVHTHLAQLDAARQVNDADRVLELYRLVEASLETDHRGNLGRELSRWFLQLIHRRLRIVPIQADVVLLATRVAETFGATAEAASLRASLPMLRRSVGLCPRCAQPYRGMAAACPKCLAGAEGVRGPAEGRSDADPGEELEDAAREPDSLSSDGQDAGWVRYDEDDIDDLDPPA